jgi:subfamily B ATP-binding cassette protein MsbA
MMKPLLDESIIAKDPFWVKWVPIGIIFIFIARAVANFFSEFAINWVGRRVIKDLRTLMFAHMLKLPTKFYDTNSSGMLISKYTFDVEQVSSASTTVITILFRDTLNFIFLLGLMLYTNWMLTLVFIVVGPIVIALVAYITNRFRKIFRRIQDSMGHINHAAEEAIEGNRVVKIFHGYEAEQQGFEKASEFNRQQNMKLVATRSISDGVIQLVIACGFAGVIFVATGGVASIDITPGDFVAIMTALMLLQRPIKRLTSVNAHLQMGIAAASKLFAFIDAKAEKDEGTRKIGRSQGDIRYENVTFSYAADKEPAISDVSFVAEPGQTIAFVGRSGSGKSTLVSLLARFYDPDSGTIRIDGIDTRDIRLDSLRDNIALVTQHVTLFNDSVANNIAYGGLSGATPEQIRTAAKHAHVTEFVDRMPEGMDTLVGENGVMLSGGQRQRLAIARALLKDAPILILDEATSALDTESERHIQAALQELISNRTTLVIAHRLSTIENADRIIVMHEGRIVEQGSHDELLAKTGHYAKLYNMQFSD